jgi:hypothetical protein
VIISDVQYWQVRMPMKPDTVNSPEWGPAGFDEVPKCIITIDPGALPCSLTRR